MQTQGFTLVNYRNANSNASADARNGKKKNFFFSLAFALGFAFHTREPEQHKRKVNT